LSYISLDKPDSYIELEGMMWEVYSNMIQTNHPYDPKKESEPYMREVIQFNLEKLVELGLIFRNSDGLYEIVKDRKLHVLLPHLLEKENKHVLRSFFYLSFLITSFFIFLYYIFALPKNHLTLTYLFTSFIFFSLIAFIFDLIKRMNDLSFIKKIIKTP
jgi:hypothetical protein